MPALQELFFRAWDRHKAGVGWVKNDYDVVFDAFELARGGQPRRCRARPDGGGGVRWMTY